MTKCIVLGEQPTEVKKKPIEFIKALNAKLQIAPALTVPSEVNFIELICINYAEDADLMFGYNKIRSDGVLYLGKWNDGVAE